MAELQLWKYEFYPYEFDKRKTPTLEELQELLRKPDARRTLKRPFDLLTHADHVVNDVAKCRVGAGSLPNEAGRIMNLVDQINSHYGLFLNHLVQVSDTQLVVFVSEAKINSATTDELKFNEGTEHFVSLKTNPIETDDSSKKYKITFTNFIVYQVIEESSIHWSNKDISTGTLFREFSESRFLDHISEHLNLEFWEAVDGRKSRHFQFPCLNYIVDVLGRNDPVIEETNKFFV